MRVYRSSSENSQRNKIVATAVPPYTVANDSGPHHLCIFSHVCSYTIFEVPPRAQQASSRAAGVFCPQPPGLCRRRAWTRDRILWLVEGLFCFRCQSFTKGTPTTMAARRAGICEGAKIKRCTFIRGWLHAIRTKYDIDKRHVKQAKRQNVRCQAFRADCSPLVKPRSLACQGKVVVLSKGVKVLSPLTSLTRIANCHTAHGDRISG